MKALVVCSDDVDAEDAATELVANALAKLDGQRLISDATWKLLDGMFPGQPNGEVKLKGLDQPVLTYWIN